MNHMPAPVSETGLVTTRRPAPALTPRQDAVLRLAATGRTYRAIASELGIAHGTVKRTMHDAYERLDVAGQLDAFRAMGWLSEVG